MNKSLQILKRDLIELSFLSAKIEGFNKSFMLEREKLLGTIAKNDSVYICDNNLSRIYNYVVDFFKDYGILK